MRALQVNARLAEEEKQRGDGDPFYPKLQWPPLELCALCRAPLLRGAEAAKPQWNEGEVARFLLKHYVAAPGTNLLRPQAAKKPGHTWGGRCVCLCGPHHSRTCNPCATLSTSVGSSIQACIHACK